MFTLSKILPVLVLTGSMAFADNVPTIHQVYQTVQSGNLDNAHKMVEQVLKAHPDSAKAHFVDAEIRVRQGDLIDAKSELETAEKLSPGLPFAKPHAVENIKQQISGNTQNDLINTIASDAEQSNEKPFPWMMLILAISAIVLFILVLKSLFSRKNDSYQTSGGNGGIQGRGFPNSNGPINSYGSGQPYPSQSNGGFGSGIASGLATGAAAGVGIVAGEALMHHFMDNSNSGNNNSSFSNNDIQPSNSMDDQDFGVSDNSSWDNDGFDDSNDTTW